MCEVRTRRAMDVLIMIFSVFSLARVEGLDTRNSIAERNFADYSDNVEFYSVKAQGSGLLNYYNVVHDVNAGNSKVVMNKCCTWNSYLDASTLACASEENVTPVDLWSEIKKANGEPSYVLMTLGIPNCGPGTVLGVRVAVRAAIGASGVVVENEGAFPQYCVDRQLRRPEETVVITCSDPATFCGTRPCYHKCCPLGQAYGLWDRRCQDTNASFRLDFYNLSSLTRVGPPREIGILVPDACESKGKFLLERDSGEDSYLGVGGGLWVPSFGKHFSENEFCVEVVETGNSSSVESFLCFSKSGNHFENSPLQFVLLSLGFIVSCTFLLFTFLVYLFSTKCRNLYEKTLMCYIASLFAAYLCLAVIELQSTELDKNVCTRLGYFLLFSFLAAFFWLNIISFDIWKTFRLNRSVKQSRKEREKLQFLRYSFYAWGLPAALTSACAYTNEAQTLLYEALRPNIGVENCWFSRKKKGIYVFFIAPISLVIALNIIFYVQTAWKIWKVKSDLKKMNELKAKKFSTNRAQFVISGKLFIVMGITWSLEIISFFAPHPVWYITDAANALHGVFIFAVFVLKKKVLHQVSEQVRVPLKKMRQLTSAEEPSAEKNSKEANIEGVGKTC